MLYSKLPTGQSLESLSNALSSSFCQDVTQHKNDIRKTQTLIGRLLLLEGLKYIGIDYKNYKLCYKKNKPYLLNKVGEGIKKEIYPPVYFNISHSKDMVLCAFSKTQEIGIDVEYCGKDRFGLQKAKFSKYTLKKILKIMSYDEVVYVRQHTNPLLAFYKLWTRKEAVLKCLGIGISYSKLTKIDVLKDSINFHDKNLSLHTINLDKNYILSCVIIEERVFRY